MPVGRYADRLRDSAPRFPLHAQPPDAAAPGMKVDRRGVFRRALACLVDAFLRSGEFLFDARAAEPSPGQPGDGDAELAQHASSLEEPRILVQRFDEVAFAAVLERFDGAAPRERWRRTHQRTRDVGGDPGVAQRRQPASELRERALDRRKRIGEGLPAQQEQAFQPAYRLACFMDPAMASLGIGQRAFGGAALARREGGERFGEARWLGRGHAR